MKRAINELEMSYKKPKGFQKKRHEKTSADISENASPTVLFFKSYQSELDAKYDKYERLVKKSRDLTTESKRIIFLLHRVSSSGNNDEILNEAKHRLSILFKTAVNDIGLELNKQEVHLYIKAFTNGLQEFVEAVSFYYYLKNGSIISLEKTCNPDFLEESSETSEKSAQKSELPLSAYLTPIEYVLGIADLTGELMRKCINSINTGNMEEPFDLRNLLQNIYQALLLCNNYPKEFQRKLFTLKCSVQKCENACYNIKVRGTERPRHMLADFLSNEDKFKNVECEY